MGRTNTKKVYALYINLHNAHIKKIKIYTGLEGKKSSTSNI